MGVQVNGIIIPLCVLAVEDQKEDIQIIEFRKLLLVWGALLVIHGCTQNRETRFTESTPLVDFIANQAEMNWYVPVYVAIENGIEKYVKTKGETPNSLTDLFPNRQVELEFRSASGKRMISVPREDLELKSPPNYRDGSLFIEYRFRKSNWIKKEFDIQELEIAGKRKL